MQEQHASRLRTEAYLPRLREEERRGVKDALGTPSQSLDRSAIGSTRQRMRWRVPCSEQPLKGPPGLFWPKTPQAPDVSPGAHSCYHHVPL